MSTDSRPTGVDSSTDRRWSIRWSAAALSGILGVLYLVLMFLVFGVESVPGATEDTTYGAYLFLGITYLVGAVLLAAIDRPAVWVAGALVQIAVVALFVVFGVGTLGPGVFEYEAVGGLGMPWWAGVITGAEMILFGLLCSLLVSSRQAVRA